MSSSAQLFPWPTARAALNAGWRVRRLDWTDRWLELWTGGLVWIIFSDGTKRVVQNTDFGAEEFLALDWTNLPPSCITLGTTPGTGVNGCPAPYSPKEETDAPPPAVPVNPAFPDDQPAGWGSGEGGGGGGSGSGRTTPPRQNTQWPTISVSAWDKQTDCYPHMGSQFVNPTFIVSVSMSSVANYSGPSFFFVTVKNGASVAGSGTLAPGGEQSFEWSDPAPKAPGTVLNFDARAWASGAPDLTASGSGFIKPWCDTPCQPPHCCPGEDGHQCGTLPSGIGCCCCPGYYAPDGPECQCVYVG